MHRLVWHSGQWYFVFLLKILPLPSVVFQQKLQERAGPSLALGQWPNCSVAGGTGAGIKCLGLTTGASCVSIHFLSGRSNYAMGSRHLQWRLVSPGILICWIASSRRLSWSTTNRMMISQSSRTEVAFWSRLHNLRMGWGTSPMWGWDFLVF